MSRETGGTLRGRQVLRPVHRRVAFVFDFDRTLADRTTDSLLRHVGIEPDDFARGHVTPRVEEGWSERLAEARGLVELSRSEAGPITRDTFGEVAGKLQLYPGVPEVFDRLRNAVASVEPSLDVEFHLLTAGFVEVPSATAVADEFTSMVGCRWAFDEDGMIAWPATNVGHYEKVRHLLVLAKGLDSVAADRPWDVDRHIPEDEWHVPFEQVVYVGDGDSDLPVYDFMESHAGVAIGVHTGPSPSSWDALPNMHQGRRIAALHEANYEAGTPLMRALELAAERAANRVQLLLTTPRRYAG